MKCDNCLTEDHPIKNICWRCWNDLLIENKELQYQLALRTELLKEGMDLLSKISGYLKKK